MPTKGFALAGAILLWLALVGAGSAVLLNYGLTPGAAGAAPLRWPQSSALTLDRHKPTLVMVVHPHCPCSRASLDELLSLMTAARGKVRAYVLFVRPPGVEPGWERTGLWRQAAAIPAVTVMSDDLGREAIRFGAATSGQAMLYDRGGALEFNGGITVARGFYGDNDGARAIAAMLSNAKAGSGRTPVYGCPLLNGGGRREVRACKH